MFRNICLLGLPCSGKTVIGKQLLQYSKKGFIDTNDMIRAKYKTDLQTILTTQGNEKYLEIESDIISLLRVENTIISTGGSVIYKDASMKHLQQILGCRVFHLWVSKQEFLQKTKGLDRLGIVMNESQTMEDLYDERVLLYEQYSHKTIRVCGKVDMRSIIPHYHRNLVNTQIDSLEFEKSNDPQTRLRIQPKPYKYCNITNMYSVACPPL